MEPFIITGTQRTGSATLALALGYHNRVACGWEWPQKASWFRRISACRHALAGDFRLLCSRHQDHVGAQISPDTRWLGYRSLFRANDKWLGSPAVAPSLLLDRFRGNLRWWSGDAKIRIIHMIRPDSLAWLRSKYVARELKSFWAGERYSENTRVVVPVGAAVKRLKMKAWVDGRLNSLKLTNPYIAVRHQDLVSDFPGALRRVHEFLEIEDQPVPMEKMPPQQSGGIPLEQHIQNYKELYDAVSRAGMLLGAGFD
jgi:hypothetical protein